MSDSKKLPTIEVGDTVTFKADIISEGGRIICKKGQKAEVEKILKNPAFFGKSSGQWYDEKVYGYKLKGYRGEWSLSAFIEPSKARVYSESEMRQCWEKAFEQGLDFGNEDYTVFSFHNFIESLNTEGK